MADESTITPDLTPGTTTQTTATPPAGGRDFEAELAALRQENAKWRTQLRDAQGQLKELTPAAQRLAELEEANKTDAQKTAERLARLEAELASSKAAAELAVKQRRLTVLATKAGVPAEVVDYLDASKFNLDDEEATTKALAALAASRPASGGGPSNPARPGNGQPSDAELRQEYFGGGNKKSLIFGGN